MVASPTVVGGPPLQRIAQGQYERLFCGVWASLAKVFAFDG